MAHPAWNAGFSRHPRPQGRGTPVPHPPSLPNPSKRHPPVRPTRLGTPASAGTRGRQAAEPHCPTLLHCQTPRNDTPRSSPPGLERRLQPAPAAARPRNTSAPPSFTAKPLETTPSGTAHPAWNAGFSRHPRPPGRGTPVPHPPSPPNPSKRHPPVRCQETRTFAHLGDTNFCALGALTRGGVSGR